MESVMNLITTIRYAGAITDFVYSFISPEEIKELLLLLMGISFGFLVLIIVTGSWNKKIAANVKLGFVGVGVFILILFPALMSLVSSGMDAVFTVQ